MIKLNDEWIESVGLSDLPAREKNWFLAHVYETLEMRTGTEISKRLSPAQLDAFELLMKQSDEAACLAFLNEHVPSYKEIVRCIFDRITTEVTEIAIDVLAAAGVVGSLRAVSLLSPTHAEPRRVVFGRRPNKVDRR